MRIYNTLNGRKEELIPLHEKQINMYVCGPTTYNYIHLGNARPLAVFDTVRRYLEFRGYQVKYVQNFTDVDDKIINRALEEGVEPLQLADRYISEYFKDADALGVRRADVHPRVSQHIPEILTIIEELINKGFAYELGGDVYYRIKAFTGYGKLSGRSLDDMLAGARVEVDERKEEAADFALWKKAKPGEPSWKSPWGDGRPGWHIECSVMAMKYLGETIDIHGGGQDLIFPHHENEIAQAEAYTGKTFVKYWMHNGFITINSEKMSKSLGNFFILRDILAKYPRDVVRYYLIATHYRSPLDFDDSKLEESRKALGRLKTTLTLVEEFIDENTENSLITTDPAQGLIDRVQELRNRFIESMDDDFNTAMASGFLFEISHTLNAFIASSNRTDSSAQAAARQAIGIFRELGSIMGIFMDDKKDKEKSIDYAIEILLSLRKMAREYKDYTLADHLRDILKTHNIKIEDSAEGTRFRYEQPPDINLLMKHIIQIRQDFKRQKEYTRADLLRDMLKEKGIMVEDTREGVRWKLIEA